MLNLIHLSKSPIRLELTLDEGSLRGLNLLLSNYSTGRIKVLLRDGSLGKLELILGDGSLLGMSIPLGECGSSKIDFSFRLNYHDGI